MIDLRYKCSNFPQNSGNQYQGSHNLQIDWNDIIWAAISVGKLGFHDLMGHGLFSIDEILFRTHLIYSYLVQKRNRLYKSQLYESLDSTEKGATSYFIGMAVSKIIGQFLFNTPWLIHLEKLRKLVNLNIPGKSRPDLLGLDTNGDWLVFEAKGRSRGYSQDAMDKAKTQTEQLKDISGVKPFLRVATESYFSPYLSVDVVDPDDIRSNAFSIELRKDDYMNTYYSTIRPLLQASSREFVLNNQMFQVHDSEIIGLSVGLVERYTTGISFSDEVENNMPDGQTRIRIEENQRVTTLYPDGIMVTLDSDRWSSGIMSLDPTLRGR